MKHAPLVVAAVALLSGWPVSAHAWIITTEADQVAATSKGRFNKRIDGDGYMYRNDGVVGGHEPLTNSFPAPFRTVTTACSNLPTDAPSSAGCLPSVVRFTDLAGGAIVPTTTKQFFGVSGYDIGRRLDVTGTWWDNVGDAADGSAGTPVPGLSVHFERSDSSTVEVTVSNETGYSIVFSSLGYKVVAYDSVSAATLNSIDHPGGSFTPSGIADAMLSASAAVTFAVGAGLTEDVVVYYEAAFNRGSPNSSTSNNWHAMSSGAPDLLVGPYYGRFKICAVHTDDAGGVLPDLPVYDLLAKGPFKTVSGGTAAVFAPRDVNGDGRAEILIDTTQGSGVKRSYMRTRAGDVYDDVEVHAIVEPGALTGQVVSGETIVSSDLGGPIAIRVQPGLGGSYHLSTAAGRPNEISLWVEDASGNSTKLCEATQWDNSDPIGIEFNHVQDAGGTPYVEKNYEVWLSAEGTTLSATVQELAKPDGSNDSYAPVSGHSVSISCQDATWSEGYVAIRSERDGSLDYLLDSDEFEGTVKEYVIRQPTLPAGPLSGTSIVLVGGNDSRTDSLTSWNSRGSSAGVHWAAHAKEELLRQLGAEVTALGCDEWKEAPYGFPDIETVFDLLHLDGSCSSAVSKNESRCFTLIPTLWSEHIDSRCEWTGLAAQNVSGDNDSSEAIHLGRLLPSADGGSPLHPITAGLPADGADTTGDDGTFNIPFYDEPQHHLQISTPGGLNDLLGMSEATAANGITVQSGRQDFMGGYRSMLLTVADAGDPRCGPTSSTLCNETTFAQRTAWFGWGDFTPRLSICGQALYQRTVIWLLGGDPNDVPFTDCAATLPPLPPVEVQFTLAASSGEESVTPAELQVSLLPISAETVEVGYAVTGGSATVGDDYSLPAGPLVFDPGEAFKVIPITIVDEGVQENDETIEITLSNPVNATLGAQTQHTYTIVDDDTLPGVEFELAAMSQVEVALSADIIVVLSDTSSEIVTVEYVVTGGTADGGVDYTLAAGPLTINPGELTGNIAITLIDDGLPEGPETVEITLSSSVNAVLGTQVEHTFTILDEYEFPTEPTFTNSLGMQLVRIEPGTFTMGVGNTPLPTDLSEGGRDELENGDFDEHPNHDVTITQPFYAGIYEVTNAEYEQFDAAHNALRGKLGFSVNDDEAVIFVTWDEAKAFCDWLSVREGLPYRLPTEAEWEYACRAGTATHFHTGDSLPAAYHKNQQETWYPDPNRSWNPAVEIVPLTVGQAPANAWGLYDVHGNVEEWCHDWYGPYATGPQTDPVGRIDGDFRVTRGGSHGTKLYYLRSGNRMGNVPEDKHWLIGFRVVLGELPATTPLAVPPPELYQQGVSQTVPPDIADGPDPAAPYFHEPRKYMKIPGGSYGPLFSNHNHDPGIVECANGDLLAVWYTTVSERGRYLALCASRLPFADLHSANPDPWQDASPFWDAPDRNDHAPAIWHDGEGTIYQFVGLSAAATWGNMAIIMRTSTDNGVTWSKAQIIAPEHGIRHQPAESVFRTSGGTIILPADAVSTGSGGTAVHMSDDNGLTWFDPGEGQPIPTFAAGQTGAWVAGIHGGVAELSDGRLLGLGRGDTIGGMMPKSVSTDLGLNWTYSASVFPPIGGGQRLALLRLKEGPVFLASFAGGMQITDSTGTHTVYGLYGALSFDDGETWPVRRLISNESGNVYETTDGGTFIMTATNAEPRGYLSITQTPDGVIQLISSKQHYAFNTAWLVERACLPPAGPATLESICDGLGALGDPTAFISPKAKSVGLDSVDILASEPVFLLGACATSTGGSPPNVVGWTPLGVEGAYAVQLDGPIEVGEWTTVVLTVVNGAGCRGDLCFQIAHLPDDIDRNGQVNINDATAFGDEFDGPQTLKLADLNGDGQVNLNDATNFGQIWNGTSGEGMNPDGTGGWSGAGLPARPSCACP